MLKTPFEYYTLDIPQSSPMAFYADENYTSSIPAISIQTKPGSQNAYITKTDVNGISRKFYYGKVVLYPQTRVKTIVNFQALINNKVDYYGGLG